MSVDIVLINPGDRKQIFQDLWEDYTAIEPPFWVAVIAAYLRNKGLNVAVIDANAENLTPEETANRVKELSPVLTAVIVYGSQPSASTQNMTTVSKICGVLRQTVDTSIAIGGLHPSALPLKTIEETNVDFVIEGEGPYTLSALTSVLKNGTQRFDGVPGLWYRKDGEIRSTPTAPLIQNLDDGLPVAAWDLLPMQKYKAHNWHCFDNIEERMPYGAIYTSLGCPYSCIFCCINAPFKKPGIRYRNPGLIAEEMELLATRYGIRNLKIVDELFVLDEKHYTAIIDLILERGFDFNIWAYARIDTVRLKNLDKMKRGGINWLALGIESANPNVRDGASKKMKVKDIKNVIRAIQDAGIKVIGNYIFGLPDDNLDTMQETLDMAVDLNCEFANFYCAMAYPGSRLYEIAIENGLKLPDVWHGFSQHSYEILPLSTKYVSAREVLSFRDDAFHKYFENSKYLDMIEEKFGSSVKGHIQGMTSTRLKRRLLESE